MNSRYISHFHLSITPLRVLALCLAALSLIMLTCLSAHAQHGHGHGHGTDAVTMDEMVVSSERITDFAANNPNLVVLLGRSDIEERNLLSVDEALNAMAGVDVKRSSGMGSRISIRGSGKSGGVLVLLNGRPLNSSQFSNVDLSSIAIDMVESITVFKPPVPVWLGAGAGEGAISIVLRDMDGQKEEASKHSTRIHLAGGSYGLAEGNVSHSIKGGKGSTMMSASGNRKDGKRTNSDRTGGNLSLHWDKTSSANTKMELNGSFYLSEYGSAGPLDHPTPDARQSYQKVSLDSRVRGLAGSGDVSLNLYGDKIDLEDESQTGLVSTLDSTKLGLKGEYNLSGDGDLWAIRTSALAEQDDIDHTLSGSHQRTTAGLGIQGDRTWRSHTGTWGVRGDHVTDFDLNPGYSGGMRVALSERWSLKLNTGYTVNIPTFGQLYQPSHGSIDQVRGNPDLDEEKVWANDATLEFRLGKNRTIQLSIFRSDVRDTIVYQRENLVFQPLNGGRSWRHGLEFTFKNRFDWGLTLDAYAIVQDSEIEDTGSIDLAPEDDISGNDLTYTPTVKSKLTLFYTLPTQGTRLETAIRYCGEQYSEMENREAEKLNDYVTMDLKVIQPFKIKRMAAEWFLHVNNVFDEEFQIHFGYPDDGVRFLSGINLTI